MLPHGKKVFRRSVKRLQIEFTSANLFEAKEEDLVRANWEELAAGEETYRVEFDRVSTGGVEESGKERGRRFAPRETLLSGKSPPCLREPARKRIVFRSFVRK